MPYVHVNTSLDFSDGYSTHPWSPIAPIPLSYVLSFEENVAMDHANNTNQMATTVRHKYRRIVQDAHDCGHFILDHTILYYNFCYPLIWPFSSRKIAYAASTVNMEGVATGCADVSGGGRITMTTCGEPVTSPLGLPNTNASNTVFVRMTRADVLFGFFGILATMALDLLFFLISIMSGEVPKLPDFLIGLIERVLPFSKSAILKWFLATLVGWEFAIERWLLGGKKGPITVTIPGVTPKDPSITLTYDPATGKVTIGTSPGPHAKRVPPGLAPPGPAPAPSVPNPWIPPAGDNAHLLFGGLDLPHEGSWGDSLDPPDDRAGWAYDAGNGWVMP